MLYKVPCPTNTNGVRLFKVGEQIAIEYQRGSEPHVGGMAFDSALGSMARNVTIRPKRPDFDRIIREAQRKVDAHDGLPPSTGVRGATQERGSRMGPINANEKPRLRDVEDGGNEEASPYKRFTEDDEDNGAIVGKLISFLKDVGLEDGDLERVMAICSGGEPEDADEAMRPAADRRRQAADRDRGLARRNAQRQAQDAEFDRLFPTAKLLLHR
jgi:hypothetical protein